MNPIRIRKHIDSETLHLPELKPLVGRTVEITLSADPEPSAREDFQQLMEQAPASEAAWEARQATLRAWRADARFDLYWATIDHMLAVDFSSFRRMTDAAGAVGNLQDYDFDAWRAQREYDEKHAQDHPQ